MDNEEQSEDDANMCDGWTVELELNPSTRIFELRAVGPATMIKHFLVEAENNVLKKLTQEAEFDLIVAELLDEWIYDDNAEYSFDDTRIIGEENIETDGE
tara:strand:+ start:1046 stop:1345 length:300 start_codon:yes stop_codon:yes gene_type:complete